MVRKVHFPNSVRVKQQSWDLTLDVTAAVSSAVSANVIAVNTLDPGV